MWQKNKCIKDADVVKRFSCYSDQILGNKCDLSDFVRGMTSWLSQKLLISWDFHAQQSLEFAENGAKNIIYKGDQQFCRQKCIVNQRGQRTMARQVKADRKVTVTRITTHYNSGMQKSISEHTPRQKWIGYSNKYVAFSLPTTFQCATHWGHVHACQVAAEISQLLKVWGDGCVLPPGRGFLR